MADAMGDILKVGLIGAAAWFVYEQFFAGGSGINLSTLGGALASTPAGTPVTGTPASSPGTTIPSEPLATPVLPSSQPSQTVRNQLLAAVVAGAASTDPNVTGNVPQAQWLENADVWTYYFRQLRPLTNAQFDAAFPFVTATNRGSMTVDQFMQAIGAQGAGLSGVSAMRPRWGRLPDGRVVLVWPARGVPAAPGLGAVQAFPSRAPFAIGRRGLPVLGWRAAA